MPRIQLIVYVNPSYVDVMVNLKLKNGSYRRIAATLDTGAEACLFPLDLLDELECQVIRENVMVQQAGIAEQEYAVTVANVTMFFEDYVGTLTTEIQAQVWFADTDEKLIGFDGVLDRATLFIGMRETRTGWIGIES